MVVRKVHWTQYFVRKSLFNHFFKLWMVVKLWFHEQDHINLSSWVWQCNKGDDLCIYGFDFFFFLNYFLITLSPYSLLRLHLLSGWVQNCLTLTPPVEASSLESMSAELLDLDPTCWGFISWVDGCRIAWPWPHLLRLHLLSRWVQNCFTLTPPVEASSLEQMGAELLDLDPTCWGFISWANGCIIALPWLHLFRLYLLSWWLQNCLTLTAPVQLLGSPQPPQNVHHNINYWHTKAKSVF